MYVVGAVLLLPVLAHPTEVYAVGPGCPDGYGWADVLSYALVAVVFVLALAAAFELVAALRDDGGPWWLVAVPVVVLGLYLATAETTTCSRINFAFVEGQRSGARAVIAACLAVASTLVALAVLRRRRR